MIRTDILPAAIVAQAEAIVAAGDKNPHRMGWAQRVLAEAKDYPKRVV